MAAQSEVFIDPIGHPTAPVIALNAYLHFSVLFSAEYDATAMVTLKGVVTKVEWANP